LPNLQGATRNDTLVAGACEATAGSIGAVVLTVVDPALLLYMVHRHASDDGKAV
jgi:hypothetical protein